MLGLHKGSVEIVPHDPAWAWQFRQERQLLQQHIGQHVLAIEHVGSTAVPNLALGYIDRGDAGSDGGYLFVKEREPNVRTHHLHIVAIDDPQWAAYLWFRDFLIANEPARTEYARLKNSLSQVFAGDRRGYTQGKNDFIRQLRERAFRDRQT
jgi:GrpB-like predicted nucleotidyltransferase (UPF0157 family)